MFRTPAARVLLLALGACVESPDPDALGGKFLLTPGENIDTYVTAAWKAPGAESAHLEFAVDGETQIVSDAVEGEEGVNLPILGLWFNQEFEVSLVDEAGNVRATDTYTTGAGPVTLAGFDVTGRPTWNHYVISALLSSDPPSVVMFSPSGRPTWFWENFGPEFIVRTQPRRDGAGVWVLLMPYSPTGAPGRLLSVAWDGSLISDVTPYGHEGEGVTHDFVEMENGSILLIGYDTREYEGVEYTGESLYQLDPDGTERFLWSFWDLYTPDPDNTPDPTNWTHANGLRWHEERESVWISSRGYNCLVEVKPEEGKAITVLGGPAPTVDFAEGTVPPYGQHHFDFREDRLLIHDNRDVMQGSRVVEFTLDFGDRTEAATSWEFVPSPVLYDFVLGDAAYASEEDMLVTWSTAGLLEQRSFAGEVPWSVSLLLGTVYGYSELVPSVPGTTFVGN